MISLCCLDRRLCIRGYDILLMLISLTQKQLNLYTNVPMQSPLQDSIFASSYSELPFLKSSNEFFSS